MTASIVRWLAALGTALALVFSATGAADAPASDDGLAARLEQRIRDLQPTRQERRFDDIGWARDIRAALALARQHDRPVFLFTYDGAGMATFRC
jgi:hypothetical protein